jgi:hypothetical protein
MVYFLLADERRILRDDKVFDATVLLVGKRELTGEVEAEDVAVLPPDAKIMGVYDLKDIIREKEAYYFPEEDKYLIRIETDGYPRFQLADADEIPPEVRVLERVELADRITKAKQDKELRKLLEQIGYKLPSFKKEFLKGAVVFFLFAAAYHLGSYFLKAQSEVLAAKEAKIERQEKELDRLYEKYRNRLYVLKERQGPKGVEFMEKVKKLPLDEVFLFSYTGAGMWQASGKVPYWKVEELKEACRREKLSCTLKYDNGGYFDVAITPQTGFPG